MTTFTIADQLESVHREPVQVILQDPCYTEKDLMILGELYKKSPLLFDPKGLLVIDSNTTLMTAFLPVGYPLMHMIADMFWYKWRGTSCYNLRRHGTGSF
ncbi:uncharacterized protein M421DRAFT_296751 [Didymella exigua CBS 183.55]|uniref:Uncharacterized protein n=1 Tax=Didymella exigua CBS 183.55 TaxID=1150837 RepID=A0A6A5RES1_9PLEO|nr:uncharacterized protein M421DRAFT_296751 [Didymella exigua CBS 183.55]KAF1924197.1 hypothetical protein M421DRAFT_296751 [Didymella exigua CBS 183.55]